MKKIYMMLLTVLCLHLCLVTLPALAETAQAPAATIDVTDFVTALLGLLASIVTAYLAPWLKAKLGAARYENALSVTNTLVNAAEQIFKGAGRGQEKLDYVKKELNKRGITYDEAKLEAAVFNLRHVVFEDEMIIETEDDEEEDEKPPEEGGEA